MGLQPHTIIELRLNPMDRGFYSYIPGTLNYLVLQEQEFNLCGKMTDYGAIGVLLAIHDLFHRLDGPLAEELRREKRVVMLPPTGWPLHHLADWIYHSANVLPMQMAPTLGMLEAPILNGELVRPNAN